MKRSETTEVRHAGSASIRLLALWTMLALLPLAACPAIPAEVVVDYEGAMELAARRDYRAAVRALGEVLETASLDDSRRVQALVTRGAAHKALLVDDKAVRDFRDALEIDPAHAEASYQLGLMYASGRGVPEDRDREVELLLVAAEQDHAIAQRLLSLIYFQGPLQDLRASHGWVLKAARQGDVIARRLLAARYARGQGLIRNAEEAVSWYRLAADDGDAIAAYNLYLAWKSGNGVPAADLAEARRWLLRAAEGGFSTAQREYAGLLAAGGEGMAADQSLATYWYWKASILGDDRSQMEVGRRYLVGRGVPQDFQIARSWFEKAAGEAEALFHLGEIHEQGLGTESNPELALRYYRDAARKRHAGALVKAAMMFRAGLGTEVNEEAHGNYMDVIAKSNNILDWNTAAWLLSTDPNELLRDGELALKFIREVLKVSEDPMFLDTEAAVQAELGGFGKARRIQARLLRTVDEASPIRDELEAHLEAYRQDLPWREVYKRVATQVRGTALEMRETVFLGSIIVLRDARGYGKAGLFLDSKVGYVMEILVQESEQGVLPLGQDEYLVVYFENPEAYFTGIREVEGVMDYPLDTRRFRLQEVPDGGWHLRLLMDPPLS